MSDLLNRLICWGFGHTQISNGICSRCGKDLRYERQPYT